MTAYLDEYQPGSRRAENGVQSDMRCLKFNNIQSCIAVVLVPGNKNRLIGVHLSTITTSRPAETKTVRAELLDELGKATNSAVYLVANYKTHHAASTLKKELQKITKSIFLCNISPVSQKDTSADVDVKMELVGQQVRCYVRLHAPHIHPQVAKPKPAGGWIPGQPRTERDKEGRDWQVVDFVRI
jgi:hypothetical protein